MSKLLNEKEPTWRKNLLDDLSFIKDKLRFPIRGFMWFPIIMWFVFIGVFSLIIYTFFREVNFQNKQNNIETYIFVLALFSFLAGSIYMIFKYIKSLKFTSIITVFKQVENQKMLELFLSSQRLIVYRHPEAPEIFQIQSTPIFRSPKDKELEVIIFITGNKRILVNNHFTDAGWNPITGKGKHKQIIKQLEQWLLHYTPGLND